MKELKPTYNPNFSLLNQDGILGHYYRGKKLTYTDKDVGEVFLGNFKPQYYKNGLALKYKQDNLKWFMFFTNDGKQVCDFRNASYIDGMFVIKPAMADACFRVTQNEFYIDLPKCETSPGYVMDIPHVEPIPNTYIYEEEKANLIHETSLYKQTYKKLKELENQHTQKHDKQLHFSYGSNYTKDYEPMYGKENALFDYSQCQKTETLQDTLAGVNFLMNLYNSDYEKQRYEVSQQDYLAEPAPLSSQTTEDLDYAYQRYNLREFNPITDIVELAAENLTLNLATYEGLEYNIPLVCDVKKYFDTQDMVDDGGQNSGSQR